MPLPMAILPSSALSSPAIERSKVAEAIAKYGIDVNKPNPLTV